MSYISFKPYIGKVFRSCYHLILGVFMEDRWKNKNVDLSLLSDCIAQFFKEKNFAVFVRKSKRKYRIIATPRPFHKIAENINVNISGRPDDFLVKFIAGSHSRALVRHGALAALFGGGYLALKGFKSQEALEKLEKEYWIYVDKEIWQLTDSAFQAKST